MRAAAKSRRIGARSASGSPPVRRGGVQVSDMQRSRMLSSAVQVVSEHGYGRMSVARVTGGARVSRRTFYDFFEDREDCFLAVFDDIVERVSKLVLGAYESAGVGRGRGNCWREQVRAGLAALLVFLDEQPETGSLLVVDALRAGPRVLERRVEVLRGLEAALDAGGARAKAARGLPELRGEGVVGAVFSVIHTRMSGKRSEPLLELLNPLMSMIVLPYLGVGAAQRELERPVAQIARRVSGAGAGARGERVLASSSSPGDPLAELPMRLTYRTLRVLAAIGEHPGASNREVAGLAEVADQGQMSKLLARLERLGLIHNAIGLGHQPTGEPNAWTLTEWGQEIRQGLVRAPLGDTDLSADATARGSRGKARRTEHDFSRHTTRQER